MPFMHSRKNTTHQCQIYKALRTNSPDYQCALEPNSAATWPYHDTTQVRGSLGITITLTIPASILLYDAITRKRNTTTWDSTIGLAALFLADQRISVEHRYECTYDRFIGSLYRKRSAT